MRGDFIYEVLVSEMSSLRSRLEPIQQNPKHHPEGSVYRHTYLVRKALPIALGILIQRQKQPHSPFVNLDLNLSPEDLNLLRISAWMHDVGKATATTYSNEKGYQAIGHENPEHYIPNMRELGSSWQKIWRSDDFESKKDLFFIINHHMDIRGENGFSTRFAERLVDANGLYLNQRRVKLLLLLILMDHIGRGVPNPLQSGEETADLMERSAASVVSIRQRRLAHQSKPAPSDPIEFIKQFGNKPPAVLHKAFVGKFGRDPTEDELHVRSST